MTRSKLRAWLEATALTDPVERGQASALQIMLLVIGAFGALLFAALLVVLPGALGGALNPAAVLLPMGLAVVLVACVLTAVAMLRRGRFQGAVLLAAVGFTALHGVTVITSGLADKEVLLVYLLPLTLAGLLSSRRALPAVLALACGAVWVAALTTAGAPLLPVDLPGPAAAPSAVTAFNFTLVVVIAAAFFLAFGNVLAAALTRALAREHELEELRCGLEQAVGERTAELRAALAEVEARAESEARLRREAEEQRALARGMSVPVLPVSAGTLVVPLVGDLDAQRIEDLQVRALGAVERSGCGRLVLDITGVPIVDTHVAQGLIQTMSALRLLGAEAVLVGIRPEVAQSLVSLGVDLGDFTTFADLQIALQSGGRRARRAA
jgi:rsbT co-antagonist protein RsbR